MREELDNSSLRLHQKLVVFAMLDIIGVKEIEGKPSKEVITQFYDKFENKSTDLILHRDPLGLAFDLAGEFAVVRDEIDYRNLYDIGAIEIIKRFFEISSPQIKT